MPHLPIPPNANAPSASSCARRRRELALKDNALDAAEQEVAAIKSEITRIAPLLQLPTSLMTPRSAEIVPLAPGANPSPAQSQDDGVMRAWTEIDAAARRVDARYDGTSPRRPMTNQDLRATFAPAPKPVELTRLTDAAGTGTVRSRCRPPFPF